MTPCIKLRGPKAQDPSRPPPTPFDCVLDPEDVLLLHYIHSEYTSVSYLTAIIRMLVVVYGPALPFDGLRHAVLGLVAAKLLVEQFAEKAKYHREQAHRAICRKRKTPGLLKDVDVFASFVLRRITVSNRPIDQFLEDTNDSLHILQQVAQNPAMISDALIVFGPFVRGSLEYTRQILKSGVSLRVPIAAIPTTFSSLLRFTEEFRHFSS